MIKPVLLIGICGAMAISAFAAGSPMKISDYPHTNSVSSNKLFIVAAPGTPGTNFYISFGELNAQIISPTNLPAQVWTNDGHIYPNGKTNASVRIGDAATDLMNNQAVLAVSRDAGTNIIERLFLFDLTSDPGFNYEADLQLDSSTGDGGTSTILSWYDQDLWNATSLIITASSKTNSTDAFISYTDQLAQRFKILQNGDITYIKGRQYSWPETNLTSGQVFALDGGTPQQIYGMTPVTNNSSIRATDASSVSTSFASTGLSVTLAAGATYTFDCYLYVTDTVSADGVKIDFNGGSATANVFVAQINAYDTAPNLFLNVSSLATAASASSFNGIGAFEIHGTIKVNAGGTFIPRFAQVAHTSGTLILLSGSSIRLFQ